MQRSASPLIAPDTTIAFRPRSIPLESFLYLLILAAAIFTRFRNLSAGALHHDESMHAYYSWLFATGHNYIHNPLLHGPLLFHLTALSFLLFGESDATARLMPAIFGTALVMLPWLLRSPGMLGRWGALSASTLILVSPSILYYSRHLRHDIFTLTLTMQLFVSIVRYLEKPERRWIVTGAISIGLTLANHEIIFAILAIFGLYLYAVLAFDRIRIWWRAPRSHRGAQLVLGAHALVLIGSTALYALSPKSWIDELITIPWEHPTAQQQRAYYEIVVTITFVVMFLAIAAVSILLLIAGLRSVRLTSIEKHLLEDAEEESVAAGVRALWRDQKILGTGLLVTLAIFVALFTTLFTNLHGLVSSTSATDGTLLYWLGQHDVRRGHQPWYYFLLLTPQYELLVVLIAGPATIAVTVRAFILRNTDQRWFFRGYLAFWFAALFIALSLAGEKMPWLIVHFTLPALLLAGMVIGRFIERAIPAFRSSSLLPRLTYSVVATFLVLIALFQIHTAWRMTYLDGDIPRDMLIYTQTAPDIPMLVSDLENLSFNTQGDMSLTIYFGGEPTWPLWWYLRDFPNHYPAARPQNAAAVPSNADVYILDAVNLNNPDALNQIDSTFAGYTRQVYILRWAYPETGYRHFAIAPELDPSWSVWVTEERPHGLLDVLRSIADSVKSALTPGERRDLYRLMVYRDLETPLTAWDVRFFIYIRNDLMPAFNAIRYQE